MMGERRVMQEASGATEPAIPLTKSLIPAILAVVEGGFDNVSKNISHREGNRDLRSGIVCDDGVPKGGGRQLLRP
jgi:hypothetical protein